MNILLNFIWVPVYDLSLAFYQIAISIASPFNLKAKQWIAGRANWQEKLKTIQWGKGKRIWFHCASLGEFEQTRPVIEKWGCDHPNDSIIITFFSPSGYEIRKNYECADVVLYLPIDTASNAYNFIELVRPDVALFVKYEFWFHYLKELKKRKIPAILFSSVFRKRQAFFKWYGGFFRNMLSLFTKIFVQNEKSKTLLQQISISSEVVFDTRFDRVYKISQSAKNFPAVEKFREGHKVFIAGSTWRKDEEMILQLIGNKALKGFKFIIAPHNIDSGNIAVLKESITVPIMLLSELTVENATKADVLVIDSIGHLSALYAYGDIGYVGGAFDKSVHNVLEPAVFDLPLIFGPNYAKSLEAIELIENGSAYTFRTYIELEAILSKISDAEKSTVQSRNYVFAKLGGTEAVITQINTYL